MEKTTQPGEDIKLIRKMMEESSKFLSLSGLSGIAAGIIALIGASVAHFAILNSGSIKYDEFLNTVGIHSMRQIKIALALDGLLVLLLAVSFAIYFSWKRCKKNSHNFFNTSTKNLLKSLLQTLIIGGIFSIILFIKGYFKLVVPVMLIYYGLALITASKYTFRDIKILGYLEVIVGLLAAVFLNYSLLFWTLGFGVFHILYGLIMYFKYDMKDQASID